MSAAGSVSDGRTGNEASPVYFVYVLRNRAGVFYTGIAKDVVLRLRQHNAGTGARFTRGRGPWRVCHREGPLGHGDALRREAAIKRDRKFKMELRARDARSGPTKAAKTKAARTAGARRRASGPAVRLAEI